MGAPEYPACRVHPLHSLNQVTVWSEMNVEASEILAPGPATDCHLLLATLQ